MNDRDRNRYEALKRVAKFKTDHAADFPAGPAVVDVKATALFTIVSTTNANITATLEARTEAEAEFHAGTVSETTKRSGLLLELLELNRAAAAIAEADETPELMEFFHMPHGVADSELPGKARAMKDKAAAMAVRFEELGFPATFVADLEDRIQEFEAAGSGQDAAHGEQAGHTASIGPLLKPGLKALKQLDIICRQKFKTNAQKLGEWLSISHIERVEGGGSSGGNGGEEEEPPVAPEPPQNFGVTQTASGGEVTATAEPSVGAEEYRLYATEVGSGIPPAVINTSATLPVVANRPPGTWEFTMTAANAGGESGPTSPPVQLAVT